MSQELQPFSGQDPREPGRLSRSAAEGLLGVADDLAGRGEFEQAAAFYRRVIGHDDPEIHVAGALGLADSLYRVDDEEGALQSWIVAASAPETSLSWKAWKQLAAARVRSGDLVAATRAYREAERRAPANERQEIAGRLGWLSKEMGDDRQAQRYFGRSRDTSGGRPLVTYGIIAVTTAIWIAGLVSPELFRISFELFGLDKLRVAQGEWWRLSTIVLVHDPDFILHLPLNMYALFIVGPIIEGLHGRVTFVAAYLLAAAGGSVLSFLLSPAPFGVGASGGVFGLFAMLLVADRVYKPALARQARALTSQIGMLLAFNLVIGFAFGDRIDNMGHIGGLLAGAWLGLVLPPRGAVTLGSFWNGLGSRGRPATGGPVGSTLPTASQDAKAPRTGALVIAARGGAVALLVVVLATGVLVGSDARLGNRRARPAGTAVSEPALVARAPVRAQRSAAGAWRRSEQEVAALTEAVDDPVEVALAEAIALRLR